MKRILLCLMLLASVIAKGAITPADNQMWWGYFGNTDLFGMSDGGIGTSAGSTLSVAIMIPAGETMVGNSTIKAIRFWLGSSVTVISDDLTVWVSKTAPATIDAADYKQKVPKSSLQNGVNEIEFTTPFAVRNQSVYVGFAIKMGATGYPVCYNGASTPNSFYYNQNNAGWTDASVVGKLAMQILIESDNLASNCVRIEDFSQKVGVKDKNISVPIIITNKGKDVISSLAYAVTTEGSDKVEEGNLYISGLGFNATFECPITISAGSEVGKHRKTITITKVNGKPNTCDKKSAQGNVITLSRKLPVTPVVEEFSGTWCGQCPRSIVGMEMLREEFGDQVVQMAGHYSDPMQTSSYIPVITAYASYFPTCVVDRNTPFNPTYSTMISSVQSVLGKAKQGGIKLAATWTDASQRKIYLDTKTQFAYSENEGQYAIAYMLLEDGMTGTGPNWLQANDYSGMSGDPAYSFWYTSGPSVAGIEYDNVVVAAWEAKNGVDNTVSPVIKDGEVQTHRYTADITYNTLIQDKSRLRAVALLIDRSTGTVVNAAQAPIDDMATGIEEGPSPEGPSLYGGEIYDLSGRKMVNGQCSMVNGLKRGVFIVNGKKVIRN